MTNTPEIDYDHAKKQVDGKGSVLPLAIRQRLWDQVWTRLLAPPIDPADRASSPTERTSPDGGSR